MARRELGQVRKEAAISDVRHVPEGSLAGALGYVGPVGNDSTQGARHCYLRLAIFDLRL